MEQLGLATFRYAQGKHEVLAPVSHENYFGTPPLYRFFSPDELANIGSGMGEKIPKGLNPEDTMRNAQSAGMAFPIISYEEALNSVFKILEAEPDIDAILGYSEGAMLAAGVVLEEQRKWKESGRERRLQVCCQSVIFSLTLSH
jgi:hypothetical protein